MPSFLFFNSSVNSALLRPLQELKLLDKFALIQEIGMDFNCVEDYTFTCGNPATSFSNLFQLSKDDGARKKELILTAVQLKAAVLTLCGSSKKVEFFARGRVAEEVQKLVEPSVKGALNTSEDAQKCYVTILDRSFDPLAPLMHSFGYQASIYDSLEVEGDTLTWTAERNYDSPPDEWPAKEVVNWLNDHRFFNCHNKLGKPDGKTLLDLDAKVVADAFPDEAEKELFLSAINRLKLSLIKDWPAEKVKMHFEAQGLVNLSDELENPTGAEVLAIRKDVYAGLSAAERNCIDNIRRAQKDQIQKEIKLNEKDAFFLENRYEKITDALNTHQQKMKVFTDGLYGKFERKELSDRQQRQFIRQYKELSAEKKTLEQHVDVLQSIFSNANKLRAIMDLEYSVATGYEDDKTDILNKHRKMEKGKAIPRVAKMLSGEEFPLTDLEKTRLLYILFCSHGFLGEAERRTLFSAAGMPKEAETNMLKLELLGVDSADGIAKQRAEFHVAKKANTKRCIDIGDRERYSPLVRFFVMSESKELANNEIRKKRVEKLQVEYDVIRKFDMDTEDMSQKQIRRANYMTVWQDIDPNASDKEIDKSFKDLSNKEGIITWEVFRDKMLAEMDNYSNKHIPIGTVTSAARDQKKKNKKWGKKKSRQNAKASVDEGGVAPWIIFFAGGVSYNEIREIRRFALQTGHPIYIGATELLDARSYVGKFESMV